MSRPANLRNLHEGVSEPSVSECVKNNDKQNACLENDKVLGQVIAGMMKDHMELFRQFSDNDLFKKWLGDTIFRATYDALES